MIFVSWFKLFDLVWFSLVNPNEVLDESEEYIVYNGHLQSGEISSKVASLKYWRSQVLVQNSNVKVELDGPSLSQNSKFSVSY